MVANNKASTKTIALAFLLFFATLLSQVLSFSVIDSLYRDNANYYDFYSKISSSFSVGELYSDYLVYREFVGSFELPYFLVSAFFSKLGIGYVEYHVFLNVIFCLFLSYILAGFFRKPLIFVVLLCYLSSDYYLYKILSELHRLKFAILLMMCVFCLIRSWFFPVILSLLTHMQMYLILPLVIKFKATSLILLSTSVLFCLLVIWDLLWQKIRYYFGLHFYDGLKTFFLSFLFLSIIFIINNWKVSSRFLLLLIACVCSSTLLGGGRINIILCELSVFYILYLGCHCNKGREYIYFCAINILSLYNLYRLMFDFQLSLKVVT